MQLDILQGIRAEVDRALAEGVPPFQKRLMPRLQENPWCRGRENVIVPRLSFNIAPRADDLAGRL